MDLQFGRPDGTVVQFAYSVPDLDAAIEQQLALGIGPWFRLGPMSPPAARYRGAPCPFQVSIAFAFVGDVQVELLHQHDQVPSALRERPLGFHHWGIGTRDFVGAVAEWEARGYQVVFTDQAPDGARFAYLDTTRDLPGLVEVIEMTEVQEAAFTAMREAAVGWDGNDPVRALGPG